MAFGELFPPASKIETKFDQKRKASLQFVLLSNPGLCDQLQKHTGRSSCSELGGLQVQNKASLV